MAQASTPSQTDSDTTILKQAFSQALDVISASHRMAVMKAFHAELGTELKTQAAATTPTLLPAAQAAKPAARSGTPATATKPGRSAKGAMGEARANGATRKSRSATRAERASSDQRSVGGTPAFPNAREGRAARTTQAPPPSSEGRAVRTSREGAPYGTMPEPHTNGAAAA